MSPCDRFQPLVLDSLYDLLDQPDAVGLAEHLKSCPACRAALAQAEGHKRLLTVAARTEFPAVRFETPTIPLVSAREQRVPPIKPAQPAWGRWSLAAAVLLTVGALGLLGNARGRRQDEVQLAKEEVNQIQKDLQKLHQAQRNSANQPLEMDISGPQVPEAGARNEYLVQIHDSEDRPVPAQIQAKILDGTKNEVAAGEVRNDSPGNYKVQLPRDLPLKPKDDFYLVVSARGEKDQAGELIGKFKLGAPVYLTHLATDKPMYQPGETVKFRSLTLDRFSLKPAQEDLRLLYTLTKPKGDKEAILAGTSRVLDAAGKTATPILGPDKEPVKGIGAGEYRIDAGAFGGEYTLTVSEADNRFPPQERKFIVNRYAPPRLNKDLEFTRKSYGPGDEVVAACQVARAENKSVPVANMPVEAAVKVDGLPFPPLHLRTDAAGGVRVKFKLPAKIERDANLTVTFHDGANVEPLVRPIPVVLKKLQVEFFPEGGDLVAGVPNTVYFQARTPLDKPAELTGRIVDETGRQVAHAQTLHDDVEPGVNQGMGRFRFTPEVGQKYELKIDVPTGIEGKYELPRVASEGVVLNVPTGVTGDQDDLRVVLVSVDQTRALLVGAYCRGRLMAHERIVARQGKQTEVRLRPEAGMGGVYRVTVFEELEAGAERLQPKAERLVYRVPAQRLNLAIQPDKQQYVPGDRVTLRYTATNEQGTPAPAILMVGVVNKSVVKLADEKTFRTLPTHFLLTTEVRRPEDLEHADFLLGTHPQAAPALDLLLGTQGWRRFAEQQNPAEFRQKEKEEADRLLVYSGRLSPVTLEPETRLYDAGTMGEMYTEEIKAAEARAAIATGQYQAAQSNLNRFQKTVRTMVLPAFRALLLIVGVLALALGLVRIGRARLLPYLATAACSLLVLGLTLLYQSPPSDSWRSTAEQVASMGEKSETQTRSLPTSTAFPPMAAPAPRPDMRGFLEDRKDAVNKRELMEREEKALDPKLGALQLAPAAPVPAALQPEAFQVPRGAGGRMNMDRMKKQPGEPRDQDKKGEGKAENKPLEQLLGRPATPPGNKMRNANDFRKKEKGDAVKDMPMAPGGLRGDAGKGKEVDPRRILQDDKELPRLNDADRVRRQAPAGAAPARPDFMPRKVRSEEGLRLEGRRGLQKHIRDAQAAQMANGRLPVAVPPPPPPPPFLVREYAHQHVPGETDLRSDVTETVYWHPVLVLPDGKAESSFSLSDEVTTFQVLAAGHTLDGRLGAVTAEVESRKPLNLEPKVPFEVTANDKIDVSLAIANNSEVAQTIDVQMRSANLISTAPKAGTGTVTLPSNGRGRQLYHFKPSTVEGEAELRFSARSGQFTDNVVRSLKVVPEGFPVVGTQSDLLEKSATLNVALPESWIAGTLKYQVAVYPSTLADLQKGLEALLREPNGCFEQTSTSNYPNLLILDYLKETNQAKPEVARRAQDMLGRGYQKLTSFECTNPTKNNKREGYEWFGGSAPAHEALTAYGLLQFRDMARVHDVDKTMIERTKTYLMSRKDGKGGFQRNPRALDTFGRAPDHITNAYIVWALTESGKEDDVARELAALSVQARTSLDPYFLALVANSLSNRDRTDEAIVVLKKLGEIQKPDGHLDALQTSITGSGGRDLQLETTALTVLAWLKAKRPDLFNAPVQSAIKWIGRQRGGYGGFGSTQSTILTLKALIAYAKDNKRTTEAGEVVLYAGKEVVARKQFPAGVEEAIVLKLDTAEKYLKAGKNDLRVEITGKSAFPYTAAWSYQSLKLASADQCAVSLKTSLDRQNAREGESVGLTVQVENRTDKGQGMTVAIVGLPAGLTLPEDMKKLKDLARLRNNGSERGDIDAWETRGRELILYWRDLAPRKKIEVHLEVMCRVPGEYRGPASRAYLYYNADHKCWVDPLQVVITPKAE